MENNYDKGNVEFHYDRKERISQASGDTLKSPKKLKGFFRQKSNMIIFADIILICLLTSGFLIYSKITGNRITSDNYTFSLSGYIFDNNVLATLTVVEKENKADSTPTLFEATISLPNDRSAYKKLSNYLPINKNEVVLRTSIPIKNQFFAQDNTKKLMYASIKYNGKTVKIKTTIKNEK